MAATVRFLAADELDLGCRLIDTLWRRGHVLATDRALFAWMFGRRDLWHLDGLSFAVALDADGVPVGIHGAIPFRFNQFGRIRPALWRVTWAVEKSPRAGTAGLHLHYLLARPPYEVFMSFGLSGEVIPLYQSLGWPVCPDTPRLIGRLEGEAGATALDALVIAAAPEISGPARRAVADAFPAIAAPPPAAAAPWDAARWEAEGWPALAAATLGAARDAGFLAWRYRDHPVFRYRLVPARAAGGLGLAVWRAETARDGGGRPVASLGRLVEFLAPDDAVAAALFAALAADMAAAGIGLFDYAGFHGPTRRRLAALGMGDAAARPEGAAVPNLLQPVAPARALSATVWGRDLPGLDPADPACPWLWSRGDSDQDRPN